MEQGSFTTVHIIPKSLGGSDDVDNLFLMCRECHDRSPNTISREIFFEWVSNQNWLKRKREQLLSELQTFGFKEKDMEKIYSVMSTPDFKKWIKDKIGIHMNQMGYGSTITFSSMVGCIKEYMKQKDK
ncbi:HNH endonuclease [Desulfoscipio gibsoniae]|uniref:Restriction endonuclease n=1 Tax=Desulfoscipio gibsoniae DSM 7213 TaxID=767817 RepID=R4KL25_9FIRM|nr:HNH endonuclease [Desulfoscipio gibsoniae]AGL02277.1 restriction endonuclease [Desulfoscipio gibsoniae DSM 7213]